MYTRKTNFQDSSCLFIQFVAFCFSFFEVFNRERRSIFQRRLAFEVSLKSSDEQGAPGEVGGSVRTLHKHRLLNGPANHIPRAPSNRAPLARWLRPSLGDIFASKRAANKLREYF
eukprot:GHVT01075790.1.p3 GENE.GHVT01075790.1~~GHVT01075790.1.p3  ORF type:complete len:115 (+),score=9.46 GHVT01075790.1:489-833(+)